MTFATGSTPGYTGALPVGQTQPRKRPRPRKGADASPGDLGLERRNPIFTAAKDLKGVCAEQNGPSDEQLLVWPFLSSALEHPTILLTTSNDYWAKGTRIPPIQQSSAASWARLFQLPVLSASNF